MARPVSCGEARRSCSSPASTSLHTTADHGAISLFVGDAARSLISKAAPTETLRGSKNEFQGRFGKETTAWVTGGQTGFYIMVRRLTQGVLRMQDLSIIRTDEILHKACTDSHLPGFRYASLLSKSEFAISRRFSRFSFPL